MLRKIPYALISLALVLIGCVSCNLISVVNGSVVNSAKQSSISLKDGLGRSLTLSVPVRSVVSLAPSNTEILYAISAGPQVVGRDSFSDYPAEAKSVQDI